jgi:hypothetical protein
MAGGEVPELGGGGDPLLSIKLLRYFPVGLGTRWLSQCVGAGK